MSKVLNKTLARNRAEWRRKAEVVKDKPATFGPDIDLSKFGTPTEKEKVESLKSLSRQAKEAALYAGIDADESFRAGSYFQIDHSVIYERVQKAYQGQLEIMSTSEALEKYDWVSDLWWKAVQVDQDKYTALAELKHTHGYFIRVFKGQRIERPIQACLFLAENHISQNVHNLIVIEDGAEAQIITGCTLNPRVEEGLHVGISEFFLGKNAALMFTMIHNWAEDFDVRPRTGAVLEDNATFVSNYILLRPVRSIQMFPAAFLNGKNSRARFNTILYGVKDSYIDVGSKAVLSNKETRAEAIARAVARDQSQIYARGQLIGQVNESRAHLDCRGILFSDEAQIRAIPELFAEKAPLSELSHEAAISPIAEEEVEYLMARGLSKEEAVSTITRGFLNIDIPGLPRVLQGYIQQVLDAATKEAL